MSAELNIYDAISYRRTGLGGFQAGSVTDPVAAVTVDGNFFDAQEFTLDEGESATVWTYSSAKPDFDVLRITADGDATVQVKTDKPTSTTDPTALGTYINYQSLPLKSYQPTYLAVDGYLVNLSATAKSTEPLTAGVDGRAYEVKVRNDGEDTITIKVVVAN